MYNRLVLQHVHNAHRGLVPPELLLGPNLTLKKFQPHSPHMRQLEQQASRYEDEHMGGLPPWDLSSAEAGEAIAELVSCSIAEAQATLPSEVQQLASIRCPASPPGVHHPVHALSWHAGQCCSMTALVYAC